MVNISPAATSTSSAAPVIVRIRAVSCEPISDQEPAIACQGAAARNARMVAANAPAPRRGRPIGWPSGGAATSGRRSHDHSGRVKPA